MANIGTRKKRTGQEPLQEPSRQPMPEPAPAQQPQRKEKKVAS